MYILLTDVLTCPRCGPEMGLILRADRIDERRVLEGRLGCPNCRETYPISGGTADLRAAAVTEGEDETSVPPRSSEEAQEGAVRLAALMGLADAKGTVLVAGPGAALAAGVAALVPEVEVIALTATPSAGEEARGVSRVAGGPAIPLRGRSLRGAALTGGADEGALAEALRVLAPGARLVVDPAAPGTAERLERMGAAVMLDQEGVVVARALGEPVPLRMNAVR